MSWHVAPSLLKLHAEISSKFPNRDKNSDGFIGDAAHQNRGSEHNPDERGVVRAGDWTTTVNGKYSKEIADAILKATIKDQRVHYVIHNGYIYSRNHAWRKRVYYGSNPHATHVHVSILNGVSGNFPLSQRREAEADITNWGLSKAVTPPKPAPAPSLPNTGSAGIGKYRVTTKGGRLNGRASSSLNARKTMTAANGYVLDIVDIRAGWAKSSGGHWYSMKYLTPVGSSNIGRYKVSTKGSRLNGRSGPGTGYRQTMTAANGYVLDIVELRDGWAKSSGGHWYSTRYLKKVGAGASGKSIEQMADEVIAGVHGNGHTTRRESLGVDGATYEKVRAAVNSRV